MYAPYINSICKLRIYIPLYPTSAFKHFMAADMARVVVIATSKSAIKAATAAVAAEDGI